MVRTLLRELPDERLRGGAMADSARFVSGRIVHVDIGDEPGFGKGALRLLIFAIAGAIVMPE
jgi:hypothetical protein